MSREEETAVPDPSASSNEASTTPDQTEASSTNETEMPDSPDINGDEPDATKPPQPLETGTIVCNRYTVQETLTRHDARTVYAVTEEGCRRWCPVCEFITDQDTEDEFCDECGAELTYGQYRLTEWTTGVRPEGLDTFVRDGMTHPGWLQPLESFTWEDRHYMIQANPGGETLSSLKTSVTQDEVVNWGIALSEAFQVLHAHGFAGFALKPDDMIITSDRRIMIANFPDMAVYPPDLSVSETMIMEAQQKDIASLSALMTVLLVDGKGETSLSDHTQQEVDPSLRDTLSRMASGEYPDVQAVIGDLQNLQAAEAAFDSDTTDPILIQTRYNMAYLAGNRSDPGRVRGMKPNEDSLGTFDLSTMHESERTTVGLYIVADGMGGHEGGETASRIAVQSIIRTIADRILQTGPDGDMAEQTDKYYTSMLTEAIRDSNQAILKAREAVETDMGSTVTAALIVGSTAYIANVGDSRTYLYRNETMTSVTVDHSLVARLVAMGMIHRDEIYTHPQRNQIYRALGDVRELEVDIFVHFLEPGDQLLLCSDGLWEMVRDHEMEAVLRESVSPQESCDTLVGLANTHGGEDNISVIVVQAIERE